VNLRLIPLALALGLACRSEPTSPPTPGLATISAPSSVAVPAGAAGAGVAPTAAAAGAEEAPRFQIRAEGQLGPGKNTLFIDIAAPDGAKLTPDSPLTVRGSGGIGLSFPRRLSGPLSDHPMPLRLPIDVADGATGPAQVEVTYYWCTDGNEAACRREQARLDVELDLSGAGAGGEAHLSYRAKGDRS
jgi:hypothetical protein